METKTFIYKNKSERIFWMYCEKYIGIVKIRYDDFF